MTLEVGMVSGYATGNPEYQPASCGEACQAPQRLFTFHYGKRVDGSPVEATSELLGVDYHVGGSHSVSLCRDCVNRHHNARLTRVMLLTIVLTGLTIIGLLFSNISPLFGIMAFISFLATLMCGGVLLGLIMSSEKLRGEELAIARSRMEFERRGYNLFWHSGDFENLKQRY